MKIKNLKDLFEHHIQDLYSAETQITKALPNIIKKARDPELQAALENHLAETERQVSRLEKLAKQRGFEPKGKKCKGMEGILAEGEEGIEDLEESAIDAGIIKSCQLVEHYEIAGYGTALAFAEGLGVGEAISLLQQTLEEEKAADEKLTEIAEGGVNAMAESGESEEGRNFEAGSQSGSGQAGKTKASKASRPKTGSR